MSRKTSTYILLRWAPPMLDMYLYRENVWLRCATLPYVDTWRNNPSVEIPSGKHVAVWQTSMCSWWCRIAEYNASESKPSLTEEPRDIVVNTKSTSQNKANFTGVPCALVLHNNSTMAKHSWIKTHQFNEAVGVHRRKEEIQSLPPNKRLPS